MSYYLNPLREKAIELRVGAMKPTAKMKNLFKI